MLLGEMPLIIMAVSDEDHYKQDDGQSHQKQEQLLQDKLSSKCTDPCNIDSNVSESNGISMKYVDNFLDVNEKGAADVLIQEKNSARIYDKNMKCLENDKDGTDVSNLKVIDAIGMKSKIIRQDRFDKDDDLQQSDTTVVKCNDGKDAGHGIMPKEIKEYENRHCIGTLPHRQDNIMSGSHSDVHCINISKMAPGITITADNRPGEMEVTVKQMEAKKEDDNKTGLSCTCHQAMLCMSGGEGEGHQSRGSNSRDTSSGTSLNQSYSGTYGGEQHQSSGGSSCGGSGGEDPEENHRKPAPSDLRQQQPEHKTKKHVKNKEESEDNVCDDVRGDSVRVCGVQGDDMHRGVSTSTEEIGTIYRSPTAQSALSNDSGIGSSVCSPQDCSSNGKTGFSLCKNPADKAPEINVQFTPTSYRETNTSMDTVAFNISGIDDLGDDEEGSICSTACMKTDKPVLRLQTNTSAEISAARALEQTEQANQKNVTAARNCDLDLPFPSLDGAHGIPTTQGNTSSTASIVTTSPHALSYSLDEHRVVADLSLDQHDKRPKEPERMEGQSAAQLRSQQLTQLRSQESDSPASHKTNKVTGLQSPLSLAPDHVSPTGPGHGQLYDEVHSSNDGYGGARPKKLTAPPPISEAPSTAIHNKDIPTVVRDVPRTHNKDIHTVVRDVPRTRNKDIPTVVRDVPITHNKDIPTVVRDVPITHNKDIPTVVRDVPMTHNKDIPTVVRDVPMTHNKDRPTVVCDVPRTHNKDKPMVVRDFPRTPDHSASSLHNVIPSEAANVSVSYCSLSHLQTYSARIPILGRSPEMQGVILKEVHSKLCVINGEYRIDNEWNESSRIGRGGQSVYIFIGIDNFTKEKFAVKKILRSRYKFTEPYVMTLMWPYPGMVRIYGLLVDEDHVYLLMELIEGPTIHEYVKNLKGRRVPLTQSLWISRLVNQSICNMKAQLAVHNDISSKNVIFVGSPDDPLCEVRLLDLGMVIANPPSTVWFGGTEGYCAPEKKNRDSEISYPVDVFASTMLFHLLVYGHLHLQEVMTGAYVPDDVRDFIRQGTHENPERRATAAQLLNHRAMQHLYTAGGLHAETEHEVNDLYNRQVPALDDLMPPDSEDDRDIVEDDRDIVEDDRDIVADDRDIVADDRDIVADDRDIVADDRDIVADDRDIVADDRDIVADDIVQDVMRYASPRHHNLDNGDLGETECFDVRYYTTGTIEPIEAHAANVE